MTKKETIIEELKSYFKDKHDIDNFNEINIEKNIAYFSVDVKSGMFTDLYVKVYAIDFDAKTVMGHIEVEDIHRYYKQIERNEDLPF